MGFRTVTGTIYKPNGNVPWSLGSIVFRLVNYFATSEKSYPNQRYAVTANSSGVFSIDLATPDLGYALYTCTLPSDVNETFSFYIATSGTSITLEDLINGAGGVGADVTTVENLLDQLTFLDLVDTPNTFVGQALKIVRVNAGETAIEFAVESGGGGGVTDHGALTGLADDDHTQYHNDARGDIRYYTKAANDTLLAAKATVTALANHEADTTNIHGIVDTTALVLTNDGRLVDARTPTAHHLTHESGGTDVVAHQSLNGAGTNTHTQIDSHIASTANPHAVTKTQVGLGNVPNTDATARANHSGTQLASTISDFSETVDDRVAALVIDSATILKTYNDGANTLTFDVSSAVALIAAANVFTANNQFSGAVGIGATPAANRRLKVVDAGLIPSNGYVAEIHADDQNPYVLGIFNDTYSLTVPVLAYYASNIGKFVMGTDTESFSIYTGGDAIANYRLVIDSTGESTFRNGLRINDKGSTYSYLMSVHADDQNPYLAGFFNDTYSTTIPVLAYYGNNAGNFFMGAADNKTLSFYTNGESNVRLKIDDGSAVAGNTGLLLYDVDNNTLERVTVGAADSGGVGFKVLRIPN